MEENKTIFGQAWIFGNSLVQDQIFVTTNGMSEGTAVLISNIWEDLTSEEGSHQYKTNKKGYFYWEVEMTSMDDDSITVKVNIECPKPDITLEEFRDPEPDSEWTASEIAENYKKYWIVKLAKIKKDAENEYAIQRKEVIFKGNTYQDQTGQDIEKPDYTFNNSDIGDITNLLNLF